VLSIEDHPEVVAALTHALRFDPSEKVRERTVLALASIASPATMDALAASARANHPHVRHGAVRALAAIDDPRVLPLLFDLLEEIGKDDAGPESGGLALYIGSRLRTYGAAAVPGFVRLLDSSEYGVRYIAVSELESLGAVDAAREKLTQLAEEDPASVVCSAAREALALPPSDDCADRE
jgi:HEAT repeat protein